MHTSSSNGPCNWSQKKKGWVVVFCFIYNVKHEDFAVWSTNYTNWNLGSDLSIMPLYSNGTNRAVPLKKIHINCIIHTYDEELCKLNFSFRMSKAKSERFNRNWTFIKQKLLSNVPNYFKWVIWCSFIFTQMILFWLISIVLKMQTICKH